MPRAVANDLGLAEQIDLGGRTTIGSNDTLVDLAGLDNVSIISTDALIASNTALTNLHGLEALQEIGRDFDLRDNRAPRRV